MSEEDTKSIGDTTDNAFQRLDPHDAECFDKAMAFAIDMLTTHKTDHDLRLQSRIDMIKTGLIADIVHERYKSCSAQR